ncbi:MAG TPA: hydantoinase/oxoprolinase family protein [Xanthobacteraceae bacterium]|jgi:N-methylhydantoinase A
MEFFIGIDVGGTFTDCAVLDSAGRVVSIAKSPTRRGDPDRGVLEAVAAAARSMAVAPELLLRQCRFFIHGCTVATNTIVERKGVRTALLTTRGHEDALFIGKASQKVAGRSEREMTHQSHLDKPDPPIIPRAAVFGISERIDRDGEVVVSLNETDVQDAIAAIRAGGCEAIAISLLWSFLNPAHERRVRELLAAALPDLYICASHELAPLLGEYERTATTVANAYVGPKVTGYVERLEGRLKEDGYRYPLLLAHCMGGLTTMEEVRSRPLLTLDSGPVSGVLGARFFGAAYGEPNIICADMGGTTFDVSLIEDGRCLLDDEPVVDRYTCLFPKVAVESIGAGGGSIVWLDDNNLLRVGPHSAGAEPGPAAYGAGATEPTVTDVNLVLGYLSPDAFLGGTMKLDCEAAEAALGGVAARLGLSPVETAAGAFRIVNAHMADLMRRTSIDRGRDPRDFVLFAYGGAGPLHIAYLAHELGIRKVYIPALATVFSALGMLTGGILHAVERSFTASFPLDDASWRELEATFGEMKAQLAALLEREEIAPEARRYELFVHVKYSLQPRALPVALPHSLDGPQSQERIIAGFERQYADLYGANAGYRAAGIEIIKCRVHGSAGTVLPELRRAERAADADARRALKLHRPVYLTECNDRVEVPVYAGDLLEPGMSFRGPAIVERMGDTIIVPTGVAAEVDGFGNVILMLR